MHAAAGDRRPGSEPAAPRRCTLPPRGASRARAASLQGRERPRRRPRRRLPLDARAQARRSVLAWRNARFETSTRRRTGQARLRSRHWPAGSGDVAADRRRLTRVQELGSLGASGGRARGLDAAARGDARARLPRRARRDDPRQGRLPLGRPLLPDPARAGARAAASGARYVRDFLPFIALVLLYEEARGVAHSLHPQPVLRADADDRPLDRARRGADDQAAGLALARAPRVVRPRALAARPPALHRAPHAAPADLAGAARGLLPLRRDARGRVVRRRRDVPGLPGRAALARLASTG